MIASLHVSRRGRIVASVVASMLAVPAFAQGGKAESTSLAPSADPSQACERAARESLAAQTGAAGEVTFNAAPAVQASLSNESQLVMKGGGRWRGASGVRTFSYSCNVDPRTADVAGVVLGVASPPSAKPAPARPPAEPDLRELSPAACESSAAESLQRHWPRVSQISFDSATRTFKQQSESRAELHGSGRALPAPGKPTTVFGFDCEIDPRDGQVIGTRVSG